MGGSRGVLAVCVFSFFGIIVNGQTHLTDSLEQKLKTIQRENKVDILNQLTYAFITHDSAKVIAYNHQALQQSRQLSYTKGEAIAYTYKGVYEYMSGQFPEAHHDLHRGLQLSEQAGDEANIGYVFLQLGNCSLEEVENDSALLYFTKAYGIFKDSTDPVTLSKVYRNLSAVYGQRYQYDKQQQYLDRAIAIRRLLANKTLLTDALVLKANNILKSGNPDGAEKILDEAETIVKTNDEYEEDHNDLLHIRALILFQRGEFEKAYVLADSARDYYFRASLIRKYVTLLMDMGEVFSDRGEYELALNNFYPALKFSKLRGFDSETYAIRNRIGWVNYYLGDYAQALRLANEALNSSPTRKLKSDVANALTLKGVAYTQLNDFKSAGACLDSALLIYKRLSNYRGMSEALMYLGFLRSKLKQYPVALTLYNESIQLAMSTHYTYGLARSNWGSGDILYKQGDLKNAARFLNQSETYARLIHSNEILIMIYSTRSNLLAAQNQYKEALVYSRMASQLNDSIQRTDLARRFVSLEKLEEIEKRDRDIKVLQQDKLLAIDKMHLQDSRLQQQFILIVGGIIGITLLAVIALVYYRFFTRIKMLNVTITEKNKSIQSQANKLREMNGELKQLYLEVSEQNEEILAQSSKLAESHKNISDLNRNLEQIVAQKTQELRTTNEELIKYNNELLQFSYTVSHNLRGPVARLLGLSGIVQTEQDIIKAREWISLISKTATDLDTVIRDLSKVLDLRNEPHQHRETVELEKEWHQSISLLRDSFTGQEEITSNFEALPALNTVRAMVQSTFYNLLSNAIKFRSPDRTLKVKATSRMEEDKAILEITDNGLGLDTNLHKEKLFKLYRRFHTHVEGRGLGLYLVRAQLEVLHGTIEVESTLDRGAKFRITLPLKDENQSQYRHTG